MIKAKDIYNNYYYNIRYEIYLCLPASAEGKTLTLTSNKKADTDCVWKLPIKYYDEIVFDLCKTKCDIKRDDRLWINLRLRDYTINSIDKFKELVLLHFKIENEKMIFVFGYEGAF